MYSTLTFWWGEVQNFPSYPYTFWYYTELPMCIACRDWELRDLALYTPCTRLPGICGPLLGALGLISCCVLPSYTCASHTCRSPSEYLPWCTRKIYNWNGLPALVPIPLSQWCQPAINSFGHAWIMGACQLPSWLGCPCKCTLYSGEEWKPQLVLVIFLGYIRPNYQHVFLLTHPPLPPRMTYESYVPVRTLIWTLWIYIVPISGKHHLTKYIALI